MICANKNGLFWAGDTAQVSVTDLCGNELILLQTISIGSSFRFADLKAYQYRIEVEALDWSPMLKLMVYTETTFTRVEFPAG